MENIDERREREELVGQVVDIIQLAADLQKKAATVLETLMLWNPPEHGEEASPEPEQPKPNFVPLCPPPPVTDPMRGVSVAVPAAGPVAITNTPTPAEPKRLTKRNRILDLYEQDCRVTEQDLARVMHMSIAEVAQILLRARETRDPRVIEGDKIRARRNEISEPVKEDYDSEKIRETGERLLEATLAKPKPAPAETGPVKARNGVSLPRLNLPPLPEEKRKTPGWQAPKVEIPADKMLIEDSFERAVHCPKGFFRASEGVRDVMIRLSDSQMYSIDSLIKIGKWKTMSEAEAAIRGLKPLLADCGLDLKITGGLVKLNRQENA